jgi:hypothetical protein
VVIAPSNWRPWLNPFGHGGTQTLTPDPGFVAKAFETQARSIVAPVKIFASD